MAKKQKFQDIVPPNKKRSIRDVAVERDDRKGAGKRRSGTKRATSESDDDDSGANYSERPAARLPKRARIGMWFLAVLVLVVVGFAFFLLFSGATVTVTPKSESVTLNGTFSASKQGGDADIPYESISVTATATTVVQADGTEEVSEKASGSIIVYNDYSTEPQRLVANTRFQGPDGNVYRSGEAFTVPGKNGDTPGTIEVRVTAAEPGADYNVSNGTEFTIPGLSGTELFDQMWATANGAIGGGFEGTRAKITDETRTDARQAIADELTASLLSDARSQVPDDRHLFENAARVTVDPLTQGEAADGTVMLEATGTLGGALFRKDALAEMVAENAIASYEGGSVRIADLSDLTFTPSQPDAFAPVQASQFSFALEGNPTLVWTFDTKQLAEDLSGKSEQSLSSILGTYPSIAEAEIVLRPFWRSTFPANPDDITIRVNSAAIE